ncbi:hypothetical protein M407DRAFT_243682 [Tulasnella calospora MUT 4182]|uniref:Uncharacterized protein n=1 Tax=Tulasnella calospora MUT 4182 TaxID=1051891 RepID=A0A0C3LYS7_9AGAM|nr:hypothetical protein M407DRAFT_243682 [Tulasnella calospora MUT 4182]
MEPPSFDSSTAFEYVDDIKIPLTELGQSLFSAPKFSKPLIPPTTYQLQHEGCNNNARVWALPSSSSFRNSQKKSSSLITDASPTFNPIATMFRRSAPDSKDVLGGGEFPGFNVIDPVETPPTHCIRKVTGRTYALFEGPGDQGEYSHARKIMDFQTETCKTSVSTYTQTEGASQHAIMQRVEGLNPWWSIQRTLEDFHGVRYSCRTDHWTGDITLTRLFDQTVIAKFIRARFSWTGIGMLHVLEPLQQDLLDLVLSSIYIKYLCDRQRRQHTHGGGD